MTGPANIGIITCSRLKDLITGTDGLKNHASVPLQAYDKPIGLLNVVGTDWRELTESELKLLHTISDMLGIAIERGRLFEQRAQQGMIQERNRLAREIHDTLAQTLTAISLKLETADALLDSGAAYTNVHELVMDALHLTRATLEDTRRSVLDLRAAPLEGRSLVEAIRSLCKDHTTSGMTVEVTLGEVRPLSPRLEMSLYRILQEALNNVHHHAQATTVHIRLTTIPETISLEIEDDGIGFDPDQLQHKQRFGLVGLNERVHLLGGVLNIESAPSIGTSLYISIPLGKHHD
jgi:two-component system NarL family sensor kinase